MAKELPEKTNPVNLYLPTTLYNDLKFTNALYLQQYV